jgi:hypothetical protein
MRFVCDTMLGRLAKYLRILGLDAAYIRNIAELQQYRSLPVPPYFLTKRLSGTVYEKTLLIKSEKVREQLKEIAPMIRPYITLTKIMGRCINCNVELIDVRKEDIEQFVPEFIFHEYGSFKMCPICKKVYWEGSHAAHMGKLVDTVMTS